LFVGARTGRINDRRRDHLAEVGNEAFGAVDLIRDFRAGPRRSLKVHGNDADICSSSPPNKKHDIRAT
jgi:hypothetical protein